MNQTVVLNVNGIKCGGCESAIHNALKALPGIDTAQASRENQTVTIEFNSHQIDLETIKSAITTAGYTVQDHA